MRPRRPFVSVADQLAAAGVKPSSVGFPKPRKPKGMTTHTRAPKKVHPGAAQWLPGCFGGTVHLWAMGVKADCSGYVSKCGRYQRSKLIEPAEGMGMCEQCERE